MLKSNNMSFNNDIYSLGVIAIILLFKNTKLMIHLNKKKLDNNKNKKLIIKLQSIMKKLNL